MKKILFFAVFMLLSLSAMAQGDSPLRIGVAGVAHGHLGNLTSQMKRGDFVIVGVAEANDEYRAHNGLVGRLPKEKFYASLTDMLDNEKPEAVVAYGSILDHMAVVEACAPRGIHVMVEKPLATTYKQAQKIAALAEKYGIKVMTNYETTWYATNHHAKRLVDEGRMGEVRRINVYDGHEGPIEIGCGPMFTDWLADPVQNGGGAVIDFGCYGANLATWIMGGKRPKTVYAVLQQNKPEVYPNVDDDATIVLDYGGCTVQIMGSWCWPTGRKDMYVYMDKGYIYQKNANQMETFTRGSGKGEFRAPALQAPYDDQYHYLKALVRGELESNPHNEIDPAMNDLNSLENNLIVCQILEAAIKSAKTGKPVKIK